MSTAYAIKATEKEIEQAYIDFRRLLGLGRSYEAVKHALRLAEQDPKQLWNFLTLYTSTDVNYRETTPLLVVSALRSNWENENNTVFIAQAVQVLLNAPKSDSVVKFL
jgi:hypothetical protein